MFCVNNSTATCGLPENLAPSICHIPCLSQPPQPQAKPLFHWLPRALQSRPRQLLARASVGVRAGVGQATVQGQALSHWLPQALQSPQGRRLERARAGQALEPAQAPAPACTVSKVMLRC